MAVILFRLTKIIGHLPRGRSTDRCSCKFGNMGAFPYRTMAIIDSNLCPCQSNYLAKPLLIESIAQVPFIQRLPAYSSAPIFLFLLVDDGNGDGGQPVTGTDAAPICDGLYRGRWQYPICLSCRCKTGRPEDSFLECPRCLGRCFG